VGGNPVKLAVEAVTIGCCEDLDDSSDDVLVAERICQATNATRSPKRSEAKFSCGR
jgi:hypothetical protein